MCVDTEEEIRFRYKDGSEIFYQGVTLASEKCPDFPNERHTLIKLTNPTNLKGKKIWFRWKLMWWITIFRIEKNID